MLFLVTGVLDWKLGCSQYTKMSLGTQIGDTLFVQFQKVFTWEKVPFYFFLLYLIPFIC